MASFLVLPLDLKMSFLQNVKLKMPESIRANTVLAKMLREKQKKIKNKVKSITAESTERTE